MEIKVDYCPECPFHRCDEFDVWCQINNKILMNMTDGFPTECPLRIDDTIVRKGEKEGSLLDYAITAK